MTGIQLETYLRLSRNRGGDNSIPDVSKDIAFFFADRDISTFVFPVLDGSPMKNYGKEAFKYWINKDKTEIKGGVVRVKDSRLEDWLTNRLVELSIKMNYIVHGAMNYPGKRYVFTNRVEGSGAFILGLA